MKLSLCLFGFILSTTAMAGADASSPIVIKMKSLTYEPKQEEIKQGHVKFVLPERVTEPTPDVSVR